MLIVARRVAWSGVTFASSELVLQQTVRIREDELALRYRRGSWQLATRIPPGTLMEKGAPRFLVKVREVQAGLPGLGALTLAVSDVAVNVLQVYRFT